MTVAGDGYTPGMTEWHPILAAVEHEPGTWDMTAPDGRGYGRVQIRRVNDGIRYRAEFDGELLGWATTLREATMRVHQAFLHAHTPTVEPNNGWQ